MNKTALYPSYTRADLRAGIVHIGVGNFHRAHMAWYTHRLFEQGRDRDWGIVGAGVRPHDANMRARLLQQDFRTTLIELAPKQTSAEVIASMVDYLPVEPHNAPLVAKLREPAIRLVSLTVTEGGYYTDLASGGVDVAHPDLQHDMAHPDEPITAFGAIVSALAARKQLGIPPFTLLSCDNLQGNGDILRRVVRTLAAARDSAFAAWIDAHACFPNSMVDCIVPVTRAYEIELARTFGIEDEVPVTHEDFRQWVIEDKFVSHADGNNRPQWEAVGATISNNVHTYEAMKLRMLNGGHQIIAGAGELLGLESISKTMQHPGIFAMLRKVQEQEIIPHVHAVPEFSPHAYLKLIEQRFANPMIHDTTRRVAFDGASRHPNFLLPSVWDGLEKGTPVDGLALVSALWCRYCQGTDENGATIKPNDPQWDKLLPLANAAASAPAIWLDQPTIYGDLGKHPGFADRFAHWLRSLGDRGCAATISSFLECNTLDNKH